MDVHRQDARPQPPTEDTGRGPAFLETESTLEGLHGLVMPDVLRIALVAVAAAAVWWGVWEPLPRLSLIGLAGLLIGGWPIFKEALENALERRMTMELSMSIAIVAAVAGPEPQIAPNAVHAPTVAIARPPGSGPSQ